MAKRKAKITEKACSTCGIVQPLEAFHEDKNGKHGRHGICKACRSLDYSASVKGRGIESGSQLEGVVQAMTETKAAIINESGLCKQRIADIQDQSDRTTEAWRCQQIVSLSIIEKFMNDNYGEKKTFEEFYQFGTISYRKGKLEVVLNAGMAKAEMGKP